MTMMRRFRVWGYAPLHGSDAGHQRRQDSKPSFPLARHFTPQIYRRHFLFSLFGPLAHAGVHDLLLEPAVRCA